MENLNYTSRYINRNFLLKVAGIDNKGNRINTLVGVTGMVALSALTYSTSLSTEQSTLVMISACVAYAVESE